MILLLLGLQVLAWSYSIIEDQQAATKRFPKNVRYNKSFDVAKVVAEDLSKYNTEAFEEILECFKTFSLYMRNGFPANVLEFLRNPAKYEIREIDKIEKNIAQDLSTRLDSTMQCQCCHQLE